MVSDSATQEFTYREFKDAVRQEAEIVSTKMNRDFSDMRNALNLVVLFIGGSHPTGDYLRDAVKEYIEESTSPYAMRVYLSILRELDGGDE